MTHLQTRLGPVNVYYKPSQVRLVTRLIFPVRGREGGREGGGLGELSGTTEAYLHWTINTQINDREPRVSPVSTVSTMSHQVKERLRNSQLIVKRL